MRRIVSLALTVCLCALTLPAFADDIFDARGRLQYRSYFSQLPFEHIDPLTGNLLLTFNDLVLPGNAGFDLVIQRTYNSKIYRDYQRNGEQPDEDSWAGLGWTLHLGRVFNPTSASAGNPVIEMPDGSRHQAYPHASPPSGCGACFVTREFWTYDKNTQTLRLPNGRVYVFGYGTAVNNQVVNYATSISDPFGNEITVTYASVAGAPDIISTITQSVGPTSRTVTFGYDTTYRSLSSMTYNGRTWSYTQTGTNDAGFSLLKTVDPPVGPSWRYTYNESSIPHYELTGLTTPNGGTISYTYADEDFKLGTSYSVRSRVVSQRTIGGRDITAGTWTFQYASGGSLNQSIVTGPTNTLTYTFEGVGNLSSNGSVWRVGLLDSLVTSGSASQTESLDWAASQAISNQQVIVGVNNDPAVYVPLLTQRTISRGGHNFTTTNTYASGNFNDYGRPYQIVESGDATRTTTRTFTYNFTPYIRDRVASESITAAGDTFSSSYSYSSTGFKTSESMYGVTTSYSPDSYGNVASATNARGYTTTYSYQYGAQTTVQTPEFTITRSANPDGTIASETRRGQTTSFSYDAMSRLVNTNLPAGDDIVVTFDNASGTYQRSTRGSSFLITYLDGFGRPSGTEDAVGVRTDTRRDAAGRVTYESYPYTSSNTGTTFTYDALNRLTAKANADGSTVSLSYSGVDVTIVDEESRTTFQDWSAFGDPADALLASVRDATGVTTTYTYNGLGRLQSAAIGGNATRSWSYDSRNFVISETQPESGTVTYGYDAVGNVTSRHDATGQTTSFTYDGNNRVTLIDYPGSPHDTSITYDASDNRTSIANGYVATTFGYDAVNRLTSRSDTIAGRSFTTTFTWDTRDNLASVTYPNGNRAVYAYDSGNRITSVTDGGGSALASGFAYHPSGEPVQFFTGDGVVHTYTYDTRQRVQTLAAGSLLDLSYGYDRVGNITSIGDSRSGMSQSYAYDSLDRLTSTSGFWGSGSYTYDSRGNRQSTTVGGGQSFNYANERLTSMSGVRNASFGYDANGNVISDSSSGTFTYTPANMLETATIAGQTTTYRYDGDNLRAARLGATSDYFIHGPGGVLLSSYTEPCSGTVQLDRNYVYAGKRLVAALRGSSPITTISWSAATASAPEGTSSVALTVRATTSDGSPLPCAASVTYATADGTAHAGQDYTAASGSLTFTAGSASGRPGR